MTAIFSNFKLKMSLLQKKYTELCKRKSDINEHLPTLYRYATQCESILELGVRGVISSWAFAYGLQKNGKETKNLIMNDIAPCNLDTFLGALQETDVNVEYMWTDDLKLELDKPVDMTFIDTFHVYGQLKRELKKFSKMTNKYIIMHDTTVDEYNSEIVRKCCQKMEKAKDAATKMSKAMNFTVNELLKGLWPAVEEFLAENKNWKLLERYKNNNGLTVLMKLD